MRDFEYTVLGGQGFIGSHLISTLSSKQVFVPKRTPRHTFMDQFKGKSLGKVFYCIGMTGDFRGQPFATVDANLILLREILEQCNFERLIYLSSTRLYSGAADTDEDVCISMKPENPDHMYNLSKAMGEALCLNSGRDVRIARISNVYGSRMRSHNFLASLIYDAKKFGKITIRTPAQSLKDYISVVDIARYLKELSIGGVHRIYNVASGRNVMHQELANIFLANGIAVDFLGSEGTNTHPEIKNHRLVKEFGLPLNSVLNDLPGMLNERCAH